MKIALASVINASASLAAERNKIRKISAVLRKLSLNAAKNWQANSGAKRRESNRGAGMARYYGKVPWPEGQKNWAALLAAQFVATETILKRNYTTKRLTVTHTGTRYAYSLMRCAWSAPPCVGGKSPPREIQAPARRRRSPGRWR